MNEILGSSIVRLRKQNDYTQEQLAGILGISYQAVSKWENGVSSPDISLLPLLADVFGVSIDELFGRSAPQLPPAETPDSAMEQPRETVPEPFSFPWPDDGALQAVLFRGHELIAHADCGSAAEPLHGQFCFRYEGPAKEIRSTFDVEVEGDVKGDVFAGVSVSCSGDIGGSASAGGELRCEGDVGGDVRADGNAACGDVAGDVCADGTVTCGDVEGNVNAGGGVTCNDVEGSVTAGSDVRCGSVSGRVFAGGQVESEEDDGEFHSNLKGKKRGFSFELKL